MSQENVEIVRAVYDAAAQGDVAATELFDPYAVLINAERGPDTAPYVGGEGLLQWMKDVRAALGDFRVEVEETIDVDETRVVVVNTIRGEGRTSGLPVEISLATLFTLQGTKIIRAQAYDTKAEALEAVGLRE